MILPSNGNYTLPESIVDSILIHQKDKILSLLIQIEMCKDPVTFKNLYNQAIGAIVIVTDMWSVFGYLYKAKELDVVIQRIRNNHELKELIT